MESGPGTAFPALRLDHLQRLTDETGVMQHALYSVPDPLHGYSIDDQARALIAVLAHARLAGDALPPPAAYTYLSYLRYAAMGEGRFHNFLSYSRRWLDDGSGEDARGRALWALGYAARHGLEQGLREAAASLFADALVAVRSLGAPRAWAFSIFGLYHYLQQSREPAPLSLLRELAGRLVDRYERTAAPDWPWFEDRLTYCNAKLPAALLLAYEMTGEARFREVGLAASTWLMGVLFDASGVLHLIGQDGWYPRGGPRAAFDQQCVDAQGTVEVSLIAGRISGDPIWQQRALAALAWFHGRNALGLALIDPATWGCYDGLRPNGVNRNMGAESIICYLLAYLDLVGAGLLTLDGAILRPAASGPDHGR
ncbi:MAG TPA: hypothetical protein VFE42_11835 [Chloroflexota bacterium]|nr:hypothetical protein [Chloroflexota bacterium]